MYPPCMVWCGVSRSVVSNSLRLSGSSVHRTLQTRILEGIVIPFSRVSPTPGIEPGSPALQADSLPLVPNVLVAPYIAGTR